MSVRVADAKRSRLDTIPEESAINLRNRSVAWRKAGRKSFDTGSKPYGAEEVREERALYGGGFRIKAETARFGGPFFLNRPISIC